MFCEVAKLIDTESDRPVIVKTQGNCCLGKQIYGCRPPHCTYAEWFYFVQISSTAQCTDWKTSSLFIHTPDLILSFEWKTAAVWSSFPVCCVALSIELYTRTRRAYKTMRQKPAVKQIVAH